MQRKKKPFLTIKTQQRFSKTKDSNFFKGVNPCFWQKNAIFSLLRFDQNKTRNNAFLICREKETFFDPKKTKLFKVQKIAFFLKGLTHAFGQKNAIFSLLRFDQNETRNDAF